METIDWKKKHNIAINNNNILKLVSVITQNNCFDQMLETRVVCDAPTFGLGAALEQHTTEGWVALAYPAFF